MKVLAIAASAGAFACSDPSAPGPSTRQVAVPFCQLQTFAWFAYQNEGGQWTQLVPNTAAGQLVFEATDRVSVAMRQSIGGSSFLEIINTTADEILAASDSPCDLGFGSASISGTIAGVSGQEFARVSGGPAIDSADIASPTWALEGLAARATDIVATRYPTASSQPANRVVVRRGVVPNNGTVAAIDFAGSESGALESATATFTGLTGPASLQATTSFWSASGTIHELSDMGPIQVSGSPSAVNYVSVPAALRQSADFHVITATTYDLETTRSLTHYYKAPSAKTLAFGPLPAVPTISTAATTPYVRPRVQLAFQAEYPAGVRMFLVEETGDLTATVVSVLTSRGFAGGGTQDWDITVPDMTTANYSSAWGLKSTNYHWAVTVHGPPASGNLLFSAPQDGASVISATRGSVELLNPDNAERRARANLFASRAVGRNAVPRSQR